MNRPLLAVGLAGAIAVALVGCSSSPSTTTTTSSSALSGSITVLAAASLTESFGTIASDFEAANPGTTVTFSFGGSSDLAAQIVAGSPADVFAAASPATMKTVTDASLTTATPVNFVSNTLEIAVDPANTAGITGIKDFGVDKYKIALCAVEVPCGSAAAKLFTSLNITPKPDTYEQDVKSVLTKVELGEADAGLVYVTDVKAAGDKVKGIVFPEASTAVNEYPIASLKDSKNAALAKAFVDYVLSAKGQTVLTAAGFAAP